MTLETIREFTGADLNRNGVYRCDCGTEFESRTKSVKRGKWTDCGCEGVQVGDTQDSFTITARSEDTTSRAKRGSFTMTCLCGREERVAAKAWIRGNKKTHWCPESSGMLGAVFTRLTVLEYVGPGTQGYVWKCRCECGEIKDVSGVSLRRRNTQSCGCLQREFATQNAKNGFPIAEIPSYMAMHNRIRKARGKASEHSCLVCGAQAEEWAYDGLDPDSYVNPYAPQGMGYSIKMEHYNPMCNPCHDKFDAEARASKYALAV